MFVSEITIVIAYILGDLSTLPITTHEPPRTPAEPTQASPPQPSAVELDKKARSISRWRVLGSIVVL